MKDFYEVRRQLNNPIQQTHEAYFENREDAEIFVEYRTKMMVARNPEFVNVNLEIDKHRFYDTTRSSNLAQGAGI